jgi:tRNA pseudouridine38-40 synthase
MPHWKLTLAYDGTRFHGWQVQPNLPTIQGQLAAALLRITGETVLPQGSGRTDAGVHALAQVASVTLQSPIPSANLHRALNRILPTSIRILSAQPAPPHFHARLSALHKTYEYRIFERHPPPPNPATPEETTNRAPHLSLLRCGTTTSAAQPTPTTPTRICSPFAAPYLWDCRFRLDLDAMQTAAHHLLGTHDFTSFAASDPDLTQRTPSSEPCAANSAPNPVKTIHAATLNRTPEALTFTITGSGFLHHMVRNLAGTLVEIGRGALAADAIPPILAARDRHSAGPTAPAHGLFLLSVHYGDPQ